MPGRLLLAAHRGIRLAGARNSLGRTSRSGRPNRCVQTSPGSAPAARWSSSSRPQIRTAETFGPGLDRPKEPALAVRSPNRPPQQVIRERARRDSNSRPSVP
jgi:hypothetical protein